MFCLFFCTVVSLLNVKENGIGVVKAVYLVTSRVARCKAASWLRLICTLQNIKLKNFSSIQLAILKEYEETSIGKIKIS